MDKRPKTVYFVRHGEAEANVTPVFASSDSPLTEIGIHQAEKIAERISHIPFDALIVSPYVRTRQTGETIARKTGKMPEYSDLFVERHKPSSVVGKPYSDTVADRTYRAWEHTLVTAGAAPIEDGENFDMIIRRADAALAYLTQRSETTIVVVSHGMFLRTLIARVLFRELLTGDLYKEFNRKVSIENTSISAIRYADAFEEDPTWRLWILNDHAHLG